MLRGALADLVRGDQQQRADSGERGAERLGPRIVGLANGDAEIRRLGGHAHERDKIRVRNLGLELLDDVAAELARRAGDGDGHWDSKGKQ